MFLIRPHLESSEEALGCATRENVTMKDKENTLIDIFKRMKTYIEHFEKPQEKTSGISSKKCETCEQIFTNTKELKVHANEVHKEFNCQLCDYRDNKEDNVQNHMIVMHTQFKCHLCSFVSRSGDELDSHLTREHFKPTFTCDKCDASCHTERMLKEHMNRNHRQNRPNTINCDHCGLKVPTISDLDRHINTYHNSNTNSCLLYTSPSPRDS